jgi:hypothetical protein
MSIELAQFVKKKLNTAWHWLCPEPFTIRRYLWNVSSYYQLSWSGNLLLPKRKTLIARDIRQEFSIVASKVDARRSLVLGVSRGK